MTVDALHIRMEGRLEELEQATAALRALAKILRAGPWEKSASKVGAALEAWRSVSDDVGPAVESARRNGATEVLSRLEDAQREIDERLAALGVGTAVARADTFERRLELWQQLVENTGTERTSQPLAEAVIDRPTRWSLVVWALGLLVMLSGAQNIAAGAVLLLLGGLTRLYLKERRRFRLFANALELDDSSRGVFQVPLATIEAARAEPGDTLRGLRDVTLGTGGQFANLCAVLNELLAERLVLEKEQRLVRDEPPETRKARWVAARLLLERTRKVTTEQRGPLEVVKFGKGPAPLDGWALITERAVLFLPHDAEEIVRRLLFDTRKVSLLRRQQQPLQALPAALFLDRLPSLAKVRDVICIAPGDPPVVWTSRGDQQRAVVPQGVLSLTVDDDARAALRERWP